MRMFKSAIAVGFCLSLCLSTTVPAQELDTRPKRSLKPDFQKYIAVNYSLVDVIVTDRKGNYVHNLTREDFEVYENGKLVGIESLDEYMMGDVRDEEVAEISTGEVSMATEQPPRNIIILFDQLYSSSYGTRRAVEMVERFITDQLQPGDNIMVVSYLNNMRTLLSFTSDKVRVISTLQEVGFTTTSGRAPIQASVGNSPGVVPDNAPDEAAEQAGRETAPADTDHLYAVGNARNFIISMKALAGFVKPYRGRKTLILLSEGMNFDLIDPVDINFREFGPLTRNARSEENNLYRPTKKTSLYPEYTDMLEAMNDAQVSIYTVNVGGLNAIADASELHAPQGEVFPEQQDNIRPALDGQRKRQEFLSGVSVDTGGKAYFNTNNVLKLLSQVEVDVSNYYILGYRSEINLKKSEYRKIEVKVKGEGLTARHRKGFFTPRPFDSLNNDERKLHMTEGFLLRSEINELEAGVEYLFTRPSADEMWASVCLTIPDDALKAADNRLDFEVLIADLDEQNKLVGSTHKRYRLSAKDAGSLDGKIRILESLESARSVNKLRVALRDNRTGKRSYFFYNYRFQPAESDSMLVSQPVFFDSGAPRLQDGCKVEEERMEDWNEPPRGGGIDPFVHPTVGRVFPISEPRYKTGDQVSLFVSVYNLESEVIETGGLKFEWAVSKVPGGDEEREYRQLNLADIGLYRMRSYAGVIIKGQFTVSGLEPGAYDIYSLVMDSASGRQEANAGRLWVVK